jgi:hypothetical protein
MSNEKRPHSDIPERIPLRLEFHYEVDDLGESYRVWEELFREPVSIGGELAHREGGSRGG